MTPRIGWGSAGDKPETRSEVSLGSAGEPMGVLQGRTLPAPAGRPRTLPRPGLLTARSRADRPQARSRTRRATHPSRTASTVGDTILEVSGDRHSDRSGETFYVDEMAKPEPWTAGFVDDQNSEHWQPLANFDGATNETTYLRYGHRLGPPKPSTSLSSVAVTSIRLPRRRMKV